MPSTARRREGYTYAVGEQLFCEENLLVVDTKADSVKVGFLFDRGILFIVE